MNDSKPETEAHIARVQGLIALFVKRLEARALAHDASKLQSPEKEGFDEVTGALRGLTYGSVGYKAQLERLKPILAHHYARNSHHPEHFPNGLGGMSLLDIVEMFCDWKAATERHADGSLEKSIEINSGRFNMAEQLVSILKNSKMEMGW